MSITLAWILIGLAVFALDYTWRRRAFFDSLWADCGGDHRKWVGVLLAMLAAYVAIWPARPFLVAP